MRIESPTPKPRDNGNYETWTNPGYGDPFGEITLDEQGALRLRYIHVQDCDRLIRAAAEVKSKLIAFAAEMTAPHARRYIHQGTCQLCGKPEDDELHAEPEPERVVFTDEDDEAAPVAKACGARPYPAGSEGDDGTECALPAGHDGPHDDELQAADQ